MGGGGLRKCKSYFFYGGNCYKNLQTLHTGPSSIVTMYSAKYFICLVSLFHSITWQFPGICMADSRSTVTATPEYGILLLCGPDNENKSELLQFRQSGQYFTKALKTLPLKL